jgi:streptogramin lyase
LQLKESRSSADADVMVPAARLAAALAATLALLSLTSAAVAAPTITEFPIPSHDRGPRGIVAGPDGALWFAQDAGGGGIGRSTTAGSITEFSSGGVGTAEAIALGPDGNLWFTEPSEEAIVRMTPSGTAKEFGLNKGLLSELLTNVTPAGIASGPDGNLWFTIASNPAGIGRITPTGTGTVFSSGLGAGSKPQGIAAGPDGDLWFTETANPAKIGRITTSGAITEFSTSLTANSQPQGIAAGPDGNLWFTESADPGRIGRITPTGTITEFTTGLTTNSQPEGITAADDGNLYFTEFKNPGRIGRITPSGTITEFATPTTNSQPEQIAEGPDGNIWFTENGNHGQIARLTVAPIVGQATASSVSEQTAGVSAPVRANSQPTSYYFEYGPTTAYGSQSASSSAGSGATSSPVTGEVGSLTPATLYHIRAVATNASGTTYGADQTFTTTAPPSALTEAARGISLTGAVLPALVNPQGQSTSYHFDWGTTSAYGAQLPVVDLGVGADTSDHALEQGLTGLAPGTEYHFRVVASNCGGCPEGTAYGADQTFTTTPEPTVETGGGTGGPTGVSDPPPSPAPSVGPLDPHLPQGLAPSGPLDQPLSAAVAPPALGHSAQLKAVAGRVLVQLPGDTTRRPLEDVGDVPMGAWIDASRGAVALSTAIDRSGHTQSATVWGAEFRVAQATTPPGMTILTLRAPTSCTHRPIRDAARASRSRGRGGSALWAKDNHGHFSTRGQNSVATVRGTYWETVERCDGTLTFVRHGLVSVRDLHRHRTVLVGAGHRYLAKR